MLVHDAKRSLKILVTNVQLSVTFATGWAPKNMGGSLFSSFGVLGGLRGLCFQDTRRNQISRITVVLLRCQKKQKRTPKDLQDIGASFGKAWEECVDKYCLQFIKNPTELQVVMWRCQHA